MPLFKYVLSTYHFHQPETFFFPETLDIVFDISLLHICVVNNIILPLERGLAFVSSGR